MAWREVAIHVIKEPLKRSRVRHRTHRLINSRHPTIGVFDDLAADADELRVAFLLETATNDRHALPARRLTLLPDSEILTGPGASLIMAAFLHADPQGGRFSDGRLGAWYASFELQTAIAETLYHNDRRLRLSEGGFPNRIQLRELMTTVRGEFPDLRGLKSKRRDLYHPLDYAAGRALGAALRWPEEGPGEKGLLFDSVRRKAGTNLCLFWPSTVPRPVLQGDHFEYRWDRAGEARVVRVSDVKIT